MREKLTSRLREQGIQAGIKAVSKLMDDPRRADFVAGAVQQLQTGKQALDDVTGKIRNFAELPSRDDLAELSRLSSRLRREVKRLSARVRKLLGDPGESAP